MGKAEQAGGEGLEKALQELGKDVAELEKLAAGAGTNGLTEEEVLRVAEQAERLRKLAPAAPSAGAARIPVEYRREDDPHIRKWREELDFFKSVRDRLIADPRYAGRFVAMWNGQVVDSDTDNFRLARRISGKYPREVVLIAKVTDEEPIHELPSPELAE